VEGVIYVKVRPWTNKDSDICVTEMKRIPEMGYMDVEAIQ